MGIIFSFILLFSACSHKRIKTTLKEQNLTTFTEGDYELEQLTKELSTKLAIPLYKGEFKQQEQPLDEITLIKINHALRLILNGLIFQPNSAKPIENALYIVQDITNILKKYPHIIIQVNGHTDPKEETKNHQDLSDNRAITIAEILYKLDTKNETYAKGCGDKKPLFQIGSASDSHVNARVEIYLYSNKEHMVDQCK
jgi:flagellar motor protein MotB